MKSPLLLLALLSFSCFSQTKPEIDSLINKAKGMVDTKNTESLQYSYKAYQMSVEQDYYWGKLNAAQWISEAYYYLGKWDSTIYYTDIALRLSQEANDLPEVANNMVSKGVMLSAKGDKRAGLDMFFEARKNMELRKDTADIADLLLRIGGVYIDLDLLDSSMVYFTDAYDINTLLKDEEYMGYCLENMAIIQKKIGNIDKAIELNSEALLLFRNIDEPYNVFTSLNNRGIMKKEIGDYQGALKDYEEAAKIAKEIEFKRGVMAIADNRGILYNLMNKPSSALKEFKIAIDIANDLKLHGTLSDAKSNMAKSYLMLGKVGTAEALVNQSIEEAHRASSPEKLIQGHEIGREVFEKAGNYKQALFHFEQAKTISDSIYNLNKTQQINELQTKFETVKKDAEITLLNKNAELDQARKRGLIAGLVLLAIAAAAWIYSLISKRKRERKILLAENALEQQKRINAEKDLEFKHKELTTKVLQLARKNEFLGTLEEEISSLKANVDSSVSKTSSRITRLIKQDISEDKQWEMFTEEFGSLHKGYLDALKAKHGKLTNSEIRLISLLKMNLSSKDIADTLRISSEGISKARYRLRKKLKLETSVELQNYLLNFSS